MTQRPGKKIGTLTVKLDRRKDRYTWATIDVELRFEISNGLFHAQWETAWYCAKTKDDLAAQIKGAATKALSIEWKRYIQIAYGAKGWPIADEKSGRPERSGSYSDFSLGENRHHEKYVICAIELSWSICEISEPYVLPENPKKQVRARRDVGIYGWGPDTGKEKLGEPQEWDDDLLPPGTLLWSLEREALLAGVITALGHLDARLLELFTGDAAKLAAKIDAAAQTDASRLLASPAPAPEPSKKKRRRL